MRALLCSVLLLGCDTRDPHSYGACKDESSLLGTTAGSPNHARCPHPLHRMTVEVATKATEEEAAALVFCKCERDGGE